MLWFYIKFAISLYNWNHIKTTWNTYQFDLQTGHENPLESQYIMLDDFKHVNRKNQEMNVSTCININIVLFLYLHQNLTTCILFNSIWDAGLNVCYHTHTSQLFFGGTITKTLTNDEVCVYKIIILIRCWLKQPN